jgi:enoyl-CoA hydratase
MPASVLQFEIRDRIATITLDRPDKLNALSSGLIGALDNALDDALRDDAVGAIVLTGAGRAFAAGADIEELAVLSPAGAFALASRGQRVFARFETSAKPTIAAVNGFALGGGCEIAMACHVRIAADSAKFGQPEVKLGLTPGYGGTQRLARLVGRGRALQLLLTGEAIDAAEAFRIGLANSVVPLAELIPAAHALARAMIANAPLALAACIDAVNAGGDAAISAGLATEARAFGMLAATADAREGTSAFLGKRRATFRGE